MPFSFKFQDCRDGRGEDPSFRYTSSTIPAPVFFPFFRSRTFVFDLVTIRDHDPRRVAEVKSRDSIFRDDTNVFVHNSF